MAISFDLLVADPSRLRAYCASGGPIRSSGLLSWNVSKPPRLLIRAVSIKYWVLVSINMI
jgi:hypothetical protein